MARWRLTLTVDDRGASPDFRTQFLMRWFSFYGSLLGDGAIVEPKVEHLPDDDLDEL